MKKLITSTQSNNLAYISSADNLLSSMAPCSSYSEKKLLQAAMHLEEQWMCQACDCHRAGSPM